VRKAEEILAGKDSLEFLS
jgi:hypothetical protein